MNQTRYPYGEDFQFKILALMAQDPVFLPVHHDAINPHFFERLHLTTVCQLILNHFNYYRTVPDYSSIAAAVEDHVFRAHVPAEVANHIRQTVWWVYNHQICDGEYVKNSVLRFGQRQALKGAVNKIIDKLERDDQYDDCREIVEQALQVGIEKHGGLDVGSLLLNLPQIACESATYSRRVPTMLPALDRCMQGGLGFGELGVIIAPSGIGKSTTLTNFGYGGLMYGFNVLHITLELKEIDIALKYASRHTGVPMDAIVKHDPTYYERANAMPISSHRLMIKYFSPGTATVSNFRALLSYLRGQGFQPQLVIVDYIKKMKYDGEAVGGLGRISDELITTGDDFQCGIWTAQQAQRNYRYSERTNINGIANDVSIIENADVALALSQTEQEHREDRFRIETGKIRRGDDAFIIACWCDYARATVQEMDEGHVASLYGIDISGGNR